MPWDLFGRRSSQDDEARDRNPRRSTGLEDNSSSSKFKRIFRSRRSRTTVSTLSQDQAPEKPTTQCLQTRLRKDACECGLDENKKFLPNDQFEKLMTQGNIHKVLDEYGLFSPDLEIFILGQARKIFATLLCIDLVAEVQVFKDLGMTDKCLPIGIYNDEHRKVRSFQQNSDNFTDDCEWNLPGWSYRNMEDFCDRQWSFLAPTFATPTSENDQFEYKMHRKCPLPFLDIVQEIDSSHFSTVYETRIHPAHFKSSADEQGPKVAVKKIQRLDGDKVDRYRTEFEVLDIIRKIKHDHLIKVIAAYTRGSDRCFIFPWAEGKNLKDFWESHGTLELRNANLVRWVVTQIHGLFDGLLRLHYFDNKQNCRHGDLKPENILRFLGADCPPYGTLVIADLGLTKFHGEITQMRDRPTMTLTGTQRYEPPETEKERGEEGQPRSRLYDIWSMGCIVLESVIWLLYGFNELEKFNKRFAKFWETKDGNPQVHTEVRSWMNSMRGDTRCRESAVGDLLGLTERLLVVNIKPGGDDDENPNYRAYSKECAKRAKSIWTRAGDNPSYLFQSHLWEDNKNATGPPEASRLITGGFLDVPRVRQTRLPRSEDTAPDNEQQSISLDVPSVQLSPDEMEEMGESVAGEYNDPFLRNLNDIWESESDNEFARAFLKQIDLSTVQPRANTTFCDTCLEMRLWDSGFYREEKVSGLKRRAKYCKLCSLLLSTLKASGTKQGTTATFYRNASTLRLSLGGQPLLSIYVCPDSRTAPSTAQIGLPKLPKPGSSEHFSLLREWLRVCDNEHTCCPGESFLPARVVDIGGRPYSPINLHIASPGEMGRYVALSHRWIAGERANRLCLSSRNLDDLCRNINYDRLPDTFKDAIKVTRELGVRFIWIDSLCIIQDDLDDWATQARLMETIFSCAYCTIAASSAKSGGFLQPRPARAFVALPVPSDRPIYICEMIDDFRADVEESPLNQRGWVLQERALSHRTLHFTSKQTYWECGKGVHSESLSKLFNSKAAFLGDPEFPKASLKYLKGGRIRLLEILYEQYSRLDFTVKTDRAIGIIGLEKRLLRTFGTDGGFGVVNIFYQRGLLWQRAGDRLMKRLDYPEKEYVPSWSWMLYDGSISYLKIPLGGAEWTNDLISPFGVRSSCPEPLLQVQNGILHPTLEGTARKLDHDQTSGLRQHIVLDTEAEFEPENVWCVIIGQQKGLSSDDRRVHYVLLIKASPRRSGMFERVGVGAIQKKFILGHSEMRVQII